MKLHDNCANSAINLSSSIKRCNKSTSSASKVVFQKKSSFIQFLYASMKPLTRKQPLNSTNNILEVQKGQNGSSGTDNGTILGSKAKKMRRYRANLKSDPERLEKARKKDRERKRAARANLKHEI